MKKITIAGGGLAGLSLGVALRRQGVPVVLHEAGRYPRHRVCGEFISGVTERTLERLGVIEDFAAAQRHRRLAWFRGNRELMRAELPRDAFGISRHALDEALCRRLREAGGEVVEGSRFSEDAQEGLVWAAGRRRQRSGWIGLKCHVEGFDLVEGLEMHMGRSGYAGLTQIENGRVNVCGLFRLDRTRGGEGSGLLLDYLAASGLNVLADRLRAARVDEGAFLGVAGFELGWQPPMADGFCAVGDAFGMIPPFTGNGMSMAFEGAELAVEPLVAWSAGRIGWSDARAAIERATRRRFRRRVGAAMLLHRVILNERGQGWIERLSSLGMLPFRPMLSLVR